MNKKKRISGIIAIIILLSLAVSSISVQAGSPRTVYGKVYIDGELAPDGTTVKLTFSGQEIPTDVYGDGDYVMNFEENNYEEGTFSVYYQEAWHSTNPPTVELGDEHELLYHVDLYVTLPADGGDNGDGNGGNGGNGGGNGGGYTGPTYTAPIADANGPYYEFWDKIEGYAEVTFDGSGSTGSITSYSWDFGDETTGSGVSPTHRYYTLDNFTVTLNVTGPLGYNISQTYAVITMGPNLPPIAPTVSGPQTGSADTDYNYTAVSTDDDDDMLKYTFDWDDGTTTTTDFYANGTAVNESHNWSAGVYTIKVKASDNATESGTTSYVVLIDAWWVKTIGYLLDTNGDGTYDSFYSNETGETTDVELQDDGTYLINSDDDSGWDWIYDKDTDTLTEYSEGEVEGEDNTLLYVGAIIIILILLALAIMATRKKGKKEEPKKETKKQKPKKK